MGRRKRATGETKPGPDSDPKAPASPPVDESWEVRFVEAAADLVCLTRNGRLAYVNAAGCELLGYKTSRTLIGRPFADLVHADDRPVATRLTARPSGREGAWTVRLVRRRGGAVDVEMRVTPLADGTVIVQGHDITHRQRAAEALQHSESRYRQLVEHSGDLICVCTEGLVAFVNAAGARMLGAAAPERLIGRKLSGLLDTGSRPVLADGLGALADTGEPVPVRLCGLNRRPLDVELSVMGFGNAGEDSYMVTARDVSEQARAAETLERAREELEVRFAERTRALTREIEDRRRAEDNVRLAATVIDKLSEAVVIANADFRVTSVNPAFCEMTGYAADQVIGKRPFFYRALKKDQTLLDRMWRSIRKHHRWEGEIWSRRRDREEFASHLSITAIADEAGEVRRYAMVISDVTKRKQDEERIRYQANYDELTGLPNRNLFFDRLKHDLETMSRLDQKLGLMFLDLDGFKLVNDTLGHEFGDLLLQEAARRLTACVRRGDTVARLGGDEFTVIMPNLGDPRNAPVVARRILESFSQPFHLDGHESFVSTSIGITVFPDDAVTAGELLKYADAAMYRAKEHGKATYRFYTSDLNEEVQERLILKNGLSKALERGEFALHYQPKLEIGSGRITGTEALLRWASPDIGPVSPGRFIPVLEETGLVVEVGEWAIRTACEQHKAWRAMGLPAIPIAVNLSARQLRETSFATIVDGILRDCGVDASSLEIEITESMLMSDSAHAVIALGELHDMGINVAMDDFGTGYSSLSYLKRFPIDTIKIDRTFVADIATNPDDAEIIRTIISMGHTLNRRVIAEGVETEHQLGILGDYRCDEIQGYVFSPPLPDEKITAFLKERTKEPAQLRPKARSLQTS